MELVLATPFSSASAAKNKAQKWKERAAGREGFTQVGRQLGLGAITNKREFRQTREEVARRKALPDPYQTQMAKNAADLDAARQQKAAQQAQFYSTDPYYQKYGSMAESMRTRDQLAAEQKATAQKTLGVSPALQQQAMTELQNIARSTGSQKAVADIPQRLKGYAQYGNSANVIGMKDVQELENQGYGKDEIKRFGLALGQVGPLAKQYLGI